MSYEAFKVNWFSPPDRPVDGTTVYIRPETTTHPRIWLAGDIVPAGIWVMAPNHYLIRPNARPFRAATPVVEMLEVPEFGELVATEKARRAESVEAVAEAAVEAAAGEAAVGESK